MARADRAASLPAPQLESDPQRAAEFQDILAQLKLTYAQRLAYFTASMRSLEKLKGAKVRPPTVVERHAARRGAHRAK